MSGATPPRVTKGAIVAMDPFNPIASVIVFQYNPAELVRSLAPIIGTGGSGPVDTLRLSGPPRETLSATITLDAVDQLDTGSQMTAALGLHPQLSALEMLMYPKTAQVLANNALAALGTLEVVPPSGPLTLFIWGAKRVAPVIIEQLDIVEQYHDPALNPLIATASLRLRVLTYNDFLPGDIGSSLFLSYQAVKEVMGVIGSAGNIGSVVSGGVRIL
jgi:hypothetical protein